MLAFLPPSSQGSLEEGATLFQLCLVGTECLATVFDIAASSDGDDIVGEPVIGGLAEFRDAAFCASLLASLCWWFVRHDGGLRSLRCFGESLPCVC